MHNGVKSLLLMAASTLLALFAIEAGLRIAGYHRAPGYGSHMNGWAQHDETLGWRYRPGVWPVDILQRPLTVLEDGTRKVVGGSPGAGPAVLIIGCSFAAGYGVTDEESLASQVQANFSGARVVNLATPGYGSHQSFLAMHRYLETHPAIDMVVYGYAWHHLVRNVADWSWIATLKSYDRTQLVHPHLEPDGTGGFGDVPPAEHNLLGLADVSDLAFAVQSALLRLKYGTVPPDIRIQALQYSLARMQAECQARGVLFMVYDLFDDKNPTQTNVENFCRREGLLYYQCAVHAPWPDPQWFLSDGSQVGHPNERFHAAAGRELAAIILGVWESHTR